MPDAKIPSGLSRRMFMTASVSAAAAMPLMTSPTKAAEPASAKPAEPRDLSAVSMHINKQAYNLALDNRTSLLDAALAVIATLLGAGQADMVTQSG